METRFAESIPSLRSLRPNPGIELGVFASAGAAVDILINPVSDPWNIPVKGFLTVSSLIWTVEPTV